MSYAADVDLDISVEELEYLEHKYNAEEAQKRISEDTIFAYSWGLIRSKYKQDRLRGIQFLHDIMKKSPDRRRDCLYYLSVAHFRNEDFDLARKFVNELLQIEPDNIQAQSLLSRINKKVVNQGALGLALVGGLAAAGIGLLIASFSKRNP